MNGITQWLAAAALAMLSTSVNAGLLCDLTTTLGPLPCAGDTEDEFFSVSDIDGVDDDISSFIINRNASYSNSVGVYDPFDPGNALELWSGSVAPGFGSGVVLSWDGTDTYTIDGTTNSITLSSAIYSSWFGMYIDTGRGNVYYSDPTLNSDGTDHLQTFLTEGLGGATNAFDITFAWEDLDLGDADFNDIMYGCIDCVGEPELRTRQVPIPSTLLLLGLGLAALSKRTNRGYATVNQQGVKL